MNLYYRDRDRGLVKEKGTCVRKEHAEEGRRKDEASSGYALGTTLACTLGCAEGASLGGHEGCDDGREEGCPDGCSDG